MRFIARTAVGICILVAAATAVSALEVRHFEGTWVGDRNGSEMVWRFDTDGLMRVDGRRAHWSTRADSILVEFDPPDGDGSSSEKAVYRFIASDPTVGYRRLFVYGFDLGQVGVLLTRRVSDEDMARLQSTMKAGQAGGNSAKAPEPTPVSRSASGESSPQR